MVDDIFKDIEAAAEADKGKQQIDLGPLSKMAAKQAALERPFQEDLVLCLLEHFKEIQVSTKDVEEALKRLNKELYNLRQVQIPEMMAEFGLDQIRDLNGNQITIKGDITVTVRDKEALHQLFRENDRGDLIKNTVNIVVENDDERKEVIDALEEYTRCSYEHKEGIHSQTLKAQVKQMLEEGIEIPGDVLNIYQYKIAKLKM